MCVLVIFPSTLKKFIREEVGYVFKQTSINTIVQEEFTVRLCVCVDV